MRKRMLLLIFVLLVMLVYKLCYTHARSNSPFKIYIYIRPLFEKRHYTVLDIEMFKSTSAWALAKAVYEQDTALISELCVKDTSLANFKSEQYNVSVLEWAVVNNRYLSCETLLRHHANPNMICDGTTPFNMAAANANTTIYVDLLLRYGGDIHTDTATISPVESVLEVAAGFNVENLKLLLKAGADTNAAINNKLLEQACLENQIKVIKYLVVDLGVDYKRPLGNDDTTGGKINIYIDYFLKRMGYEKGSQEDDAMQEVLRYIKEHGVVKTIARPGDPDYDN